MKKIFFLMICSLLILSGCSKKSDYSNDKLSMYSSYYSAVLQNTNFEEYSRHFDISAEVTESKQGNYYYYVSVDNPQIAMYDVEMIVLEGLDDFDENDMMPSFGIFDEQEYNMLPYQYNSEKGYVKGFVASGDMDSLQDHLYVMVAWKDITRLNQTREFLEIILDDGSDYPHEAEVEADAEIEVEEE